jgi:GPH family glycoside/pentoside/hexuronide:cation symporter
MTEQRIKEKYENSKLIMTSYGAYQTFSQWITGAFGLYVFFFYEAEIGLNVGIAAIALIAYSIWNAVNDPLIGYIMERIHMPWEKRWGKRFPWAFLGAIPWLFSYLAIFLVPFSWHPVNDQWLIFTWLLVTLVIYDTLFTLWNVNATAMYPDKFPGVAERRTATGIGTLMGMIGIVAGSIIPPFFITTGIPQTYRICAWIGVGLGLILFLFMIPGIRENPKMRAKYLEHREIAKGKEREPFFKTAKRAITDRRFMVKVIYFFGYQAAVALLSASGPYMITYVLREEASALGILMAFMLIGALISVPIWTFISQRVNNNKKMSLAAGWVMVITFLPIFFVNGFYFFMIALFLFGIGLGGQWFMDPPAMGDVLDDLAIRTGKREAAIYYGYQAFFIRLSGSFQAIIFAIIHTLTGFPAGVTSYSQLIARSSTPELALLGIRTHAALLPAILVLITIFIFWKWYDLTPQKVAENKEKLKELGL